MAIMDENSHYVIGCWALEVSSYTPKRILCSELLLLNRDFDIKLSIIVTLSIVRTFLYRPDGVDISEIPLYFTNNA